MVKEGSTLISFLYPNQNKQIVEALAGRKATAFAMEMIPRISRAQVFDALRFVWPCPSRQTCHIEQLCDAAPWPTSLDTRQSSRLPIISVATLLVRLLLLGASSDIRS